MLLSSFLIEELDKERRLLREKDKQSNNNSLATTAVVMFADEKEIICSSSLWDLFATSNDDDDDDDHRTPNQLPSSSLSTKLPTQQLNKERRSSFKRIIKKDYTFSSHDCVFFSSTPSLQIQSNAS